MITRCSNNAQKVLVERNPHVQSPWRLWSLQARRCRVWHARAGVVATRGLLNTHGDVGGFTRCGWCRCAARVGHPAIPPLRAAQSSHAQAGGGGVHVKGGWWQRRAGCLRAGLRHDEPQASPRHSSQVRRGVERIVSPLSLVCASRN